MSKSSSTKKRKNIWICLVLIINTGVVGLVLTWFLEKMYIKLSTIEPDCPGMKAGTVYDGDCNPIR